MSTTALLIAIIWLGCAALAYIIGRDKGRPGTGLALGLLLGIVGVVVVAMLDTRALDDGHRSARADRYETCECGHEGYAHRPECRGTDCACTAFAKAVR